MGLCYTISPIFGSICTIWYICYDVTGTFVTDMVLLRRGGSFVAKLEKSITNHETIT